MSTLTIFGRYYQWRRALAALVAAAVVVSGCETISHERQGEIIGAVVGGVAGAQIGEGRGRTAAIIIGTVAGTMIGRHIGRTMDDNDRVVAAQALNDKRTGESTTWVNPDTGNTYTLTPTRTYEENGAPCREFQLGATVGRQPAEDATGIACRQADGSWVMR